LGVSIAQCQAKAWRSVNDDLKSHAALAAHSEERISLLEKNSQVVNAKLAEQIPEIHDTLRKLGAKLLRTTEDLESESEKHSRVQQQSMDRMLQCEERMLVLEKAHEALINETQKQNTARERLEAKLADFRDMEKQLRVQESETMRLKVEVAALTQKLDTRLVKAEQMYLTINETLESKVLRDLNVLNIASTATEAALEKIHSTNLQQEHKMSELGRCMKKTEIELKDKAPVAVTDQVHNLAEKMREMTVWNTENYTKMRDASASDNRKISDAMEAMQALMKECHGYQDKLAAFSNDMSEKVDATVNKNQTSTTMMLKVLEEENSAREHMETYLSKLHLHLEARGLAGSERFEGYKPSRAAWTTLAHSLEYSEKSQPRGEGEGERAHKTLRGAALSEPRAAHPNGDKPPHLAPDVGGPSQAKSLVGTLPLASAPAGAQTAGAQTSSAVLSVREISTQQNREAMISASGGLSVREKMSKSAFDQVVAMREKQAKAAQQSREAGELEDPANVDDELSDTRIVHNCAASETGLAGSELQAEVRS